MKKVLILFVMFAYMNCYFGCTKMVLKEYPVSDLKSASDRSQILIVVNDSTMIELASVTCCVVNDSLIGMAESSGGEEKEYRIAINDIDKIVIPEKKITTEGYILAIILGVVGGVVLIYIVKWGIDRIHSPKIKIM